MSSAVHAYKTRRTYHARWAAKYARAAYLCFGLAGFALPLRAPWVSAGVFSVGLILLRLSWRERCRAFQVLP